MGTVREFLRRIAAPIRASDSSDGELLRRFLDRQDEPAFAALLRRHGPMVLGVCRRVLTDPDDAEDAFQATFLVLVRKARSIVKHDSLASWLFGVARRVAVRAKGNSARRRRLEGQVTPMAEPDALHELVWKDLRSALDAEVARLPERCRAPFLLCYLEGKTNEEAARLLGCPKGTVLSRLAKARELLRARLTRRGLALSAGFLSALVADSAQATVPGALSASTLQAATGVAAGHAAASVHVAALTEGMVRTMSLQTFRTAFAVCLGAVVLAGLLGLAGYQAWAAGQPPQNSPEKKGEKLTGDARKLQGTWEVAEFIVEGKVIPGEKIQGTTVTFSGDKMSLKYGAVSNEPVRILSFKVDASKKPKAIDFTVVDGDKKGEKGPGIYDLDGDRLRMCLPNAEITDRPTEFAAPRGSMLIVMTLKRAPKEKK